MSLHEYLRHCWDFRRLQQSPRRMLGGVFANKTHFWQGVPLGRS